MSETEYIRRGDKRMAVQRYEAKIDRLRTQVRDYQQEIKALNRERRALLDTDEQYLSVIPDEGEMLRALVRKTDRYATAIDQLLTRANELAESSGRKPLDIGEFLGGPDLKDHGAHRDGDFQEAARNVDDPERLVLQNEYLIAQLTRMELRLEALAETVDELQTARALVNNLRRQHRPLEITGGTRDLAVLGEECRSVRGDLDVSRQSVSLLSEERGRLQEQLTQARQEIEDLQARVEYLQNGGAGAPNGNGGGDEGDSDSDALRQQLEEAEAGNQRLVMEVAESRRKQAELERRLRLGEAPANEDGQEAALRREIENLSREVVSLQDDQRRQQEQHDELLAERAADKQTIAGLQKELDDSRRSVAALETELGQRQQKLREQATQMEVVQEELNELRDERGRLQADLHRVSGKIDSLEERAQAAEQERERLEKVIEQERAARGEAEGRVASAQDAHHAALLDQAAYQELRAEHQVQTQELAQVKEMKSRLEAALRQIKQERDQLQQELNALRESQQEGHERLQTADGEKQRLAQALKQVRESEDALRQQLEAARQQTEDLQRQVDEGNAAQAEDQEALGSLQNMHAKQGEELAQLREAHEQLQSSLDALRGQEEQARGQLQEAQDALAERQAAADEAAQARDGLAAELETTRHELETLRHDAANAGSLREELTAAQQQLQEREDVQQALDEANTALETARREADEARGQVEQLGAQLDELRGEKEALEARVAEAESAAGERQAQIDDLNGQVETLSNQVRKRSELLAHAEEDVRVLQEQVERQGEAPEPGPEMDELRNRLEEAEQERTRLSAELDAARRQVEQLQQQPAAAAAPATPTPATLPQDYPEADVDDYGLPPEDEDGERPRIEGFALQGMIGRGPKGRVYHALKQSSQRHVAFKILHHSVAESQAVLVRLLQDLPRLAALGSANILRQICPGKLSGVVPIAMDFCKKGSLLRRLLRGPIPEPEALAIALQVTSAVRVASAAGLLHLNIKPTNILFAEDDHPLLADFALTPGPDDGTLNLRTGGAWCYSAPELTDPTATPDVRADIYSIGALLYHMLSGDPPFAGDTGAAARDRQKQPARPVREAHAGISEPAEMVVARCLRRNPDSRPQRPSDLVLELERAIDGRPPVQ